VKAPRLPVIEHYYIHKHIHRHHLQAIKEREDYLEQLEDDEGAAYQADLVGSPRPFFTLTEQWGLLGGLVGLVMVLSTMGLLDDSLLDLLEPLTSGGLEQSQAIEALSTLNAEGTAGAAGAEVAGGMLEPVLNIALPGLLASLGSLAGLVVQGIKEPTKKGPEGSTEERPSFFVPSATFPKTNKGKWNATSSLKVRPMSGWDLAMKNFKSEWRMLLRAARFKGSSLRRTPRYVDILTLSNQAVKDREDARPQVPTPPPVRLAYDVLCWFIDVVFEDRPIQRFWFLETVARMPYFAYSSVLHLYETFGWWRSPELRAVHAAEEDNELHHLLVMESLGGDQRWLDRFFAQHGAIAYYWLLVLFFFVDPKWSYNFSRLIEAHAVDTYGEFADANKERLRKIPPPPIAVEYYLNDEHYLFDKMHTSLPEGFKRRPPCATLYDVFCNIRDDEEQHVQTMTACEEWSKGGKPPVDLGFNFNSKLTKEEYIRKVTQSAEGRAAWTAWGEEVARIAEVGAESER